MLTYYDVLGVPVSADKDEVRRAYRLKAQLLHPDRHAGMSEPLRREAETSMKTLNDAWNTLGNPASRRNYDFENGLVQTEEPPVWVAPNTGHGRPVAEHECQVCGSYPAVDVVLRQETGKLIWRVRRRAEGRFCRDCGLALFRSTQNLTLMTGWWGVISFVVNFGSIIGNLGAWWKFRSLAGPHRDLGVEASVDEPLQPGSPLYRRAGIWVAAVVLSVVALVITGETSPQGGSYPASPGSSGGAVRSSDTWTAADRSEMRSTAVQAGFDYSQADCIVRTLTNRYSPSDDITEAAIQRLADSCS